MRIKSLIVLGGLLVVASVFAEPMLSYRPGKTGVYDVWLKWTFTDGRQDARIEVSHMGGVTGVAVNQQNMPGWHFVGTFALAKDSEILATNRSVDTKNAVADPPRGFEDVKLVPSASRTVELAAHEGLSVCELNVGDTALFRMADGCVRRIELAGASSEILARRKDGTRVSRYSFTMKLVVDGVERTLVTTVPSSAYVNAVPFEFDGLQIFPDGAYFYRSPKSGRLFMIWSTHNPARPPDRDYCVVVAESETGRLKGPWVNHKLLFDDNGGHGMFFRKTDGTLMLCVHSPEKWGHERARFLPVADDGRTLYIPWR